MGKFDNLFARGGAPWTVKFYKERVLSALTADLARREENGIDQEVCNDVYAALNQAVLIVEDIKDGGWFFKHFYENLEEFRDIYKSWNGVNNQFKRHSLHKVLRKKKKNMFKSFYKKMEKAKVENSPERAQQYQILWDVEAERMDKLNYTFQTLVDRYGNELFTDLKHTLREFNKKRA